MKKAMVLAACIALLAAGAAQAAILTVGADYTETIHMENSARRSFDWGGGSFDVSSLNNVPLPYLYCIDTVNSIIPGRTYDASVTTNGVIHSGTVNNADRVAWLLTQYAAGASGDTRKEAALQAAIWHVINPNLVLDTTGGFFDRGYYRKSSNTLAWYNLYISGIPTSAMIDDGILANFFWISPTDDGKIAQGLIAPVPVPGTILLLGSGLAGLVGIARFRRKRSKG